MNVRTTFGGIFCTALVAGLTLASPAYANFALFPGTAAEVIDGGPGDASGVVNGEIVIDTPITVPGTGGEISFMGLVEHVTVGPFVGPVPSERSIRITEIPTGQGFNNAGSPAQFFNTSATPSFFSLSSPVLLVEVPYSQLAVVPGPGQAPTLELEIDGWLDTTGSLAGDERIAMEISASTQWIDGAAGEPVPAGWTNTGLTTPTVPVYDFSIEPGDYDTSPGEMQLRLMSLELADGGSFNFPTSIAGGAAVPEPSSLAIVGAAGGLALLRRRRA